MFENFSSLLLAATQDAWSDAWLGIDPQARFPLLIILIVFGAGVLIALAAITANVVKTVHRRRVEEGLKREMLDRGMSAEEIVKVIESAAPPEDAVGRWVASWGPKK